MNAPHWRPAYIGIGANLDSPRDQVETAIEALGHLPESVLVACSSLYRSAPMGPPGQPDYVNAVVALLTQLDAQSLLGELQAIERQQGRTRGTERWGPRTLDLDLLAFSGQVIDTPDLTVPHPRIAERNFVLLPWQEISPHYRLPNGANIAGLASAVSLSKPRIERME